MLKRLLPVLLVLFALPAHAVWEANAPDQLADLYSVTRYRHSWGNTATDSDALDFAVCQNNLARLQAKLEPASAGTVVLRECNSPSQALSECPTLTVNPALDRYEWRDVRSAQGNYLTRRYLVADVLTGSGFGAQTASIEVRCLVPSDTLVSTTRQSPASSMRWIENNMFSNADETSLMSVAGGTATAGTTTTILQDSNAAYTINAYTPNHILCIRQLCQTIASNTATSVTLTGALTGLASGANYWIFPATSTEMPPVTSPVHWLRYANEIVGGGQSGAAPAALDAVRRTDQPFQHLTNFLFGHGNTAGRGMVSILDPHIPSVVVSNATVSGSKFFNPPYAITFIADIGYTDSPINQSAAAFGLMGIFNSPILSNGELDGTADDGDASFGQFLGFYQGLDGKLYAAAIDTTYAMVGPICSITGCDGSYTVLSNPDLGVTVEGDREYRLRLEVRIPELSGNGSCIGNNYAGTNVTIDWYVNDALLFQMPSAVLQVCVVFSNEMRPGVAILKAPGAGSNRNVRVNTIKVGSGFTY